MKEKVRVRNEEDAQALDLKIQKELGVKVSKYRNPEVAEKLVDLLVFPQFVVNWTIRPIIAALLVYIGIFYFVEFGAAWATVYLILGLVLFLLDGILGGILLVLWKLKKDIFEVVAYTLNIMKDAVTDMKSIGKNTSTENRRAQLKLLFSGILHIVTIPTLSSALSNKVPFIGGAINNVVLKVLRLIGSRIKFDYQPSQDELEHPEDAQATVKGYVKAIEKTINGLDALLSIIMRVAQTPFIIAFCIMLFLTALLLLVSTP